MIELTVNEKRPPSNRLRFEGKTYVLIGPASASSAVCFASAMKHYRIGTLVGQETLDTTSNYGDCLNFVLPNSGLRASAACKYWVYPGSREDGRGVIPHHEVKQKQEDGGVLN